MTTITMIAAAVTGLWLITVAFFCNTKNWQSALIFQIVPFTMGMFWLGMAIIHFMAIHLFLTTAAN